MSGPRTGTGQSPRVTPVVPTPGFIQLASGARIYSGLGVPPNTLGQDGDLYARKFGGGPGIGHWYFNTAGVWASIA
jgi:hypothetical protein